MLVSYVILEPIMLTIKMNYHTGPLWKNKGVENEVWVVQVSISTIVNLSLSMTILGAIIIKKSPTVCSVEETESVEEASSISVP